MARLDLQLTRPPFEAHANVVAAWAFGSARDGEAPPGGDLDLGILFAEKPSVDERLELCGALQKALDFENIDLVTLNDASSILAFEAVSGRLLFSRDEGRRAEFVSLTARQYEDDMALAHRHLRRKN